MNTTPNIGLKKPLQGEKYDIGIYNANMDRIDAVIGNLPKEGEKYINEILSDLEIESPTEPLRQAVGNYWLF